MRNLGEWLKKPLSEISSSWMIAFAVVALLGFVDATYLTVEHYRGVVPPCTTAGCEIVLTSEYSVLFGVPTALFGSVYYFLILLASFIYIESRHGGGGIRSVHNLVAKYAFLMTSVGFVMSAWFTYLQMFVIKSYCMYCLISAGLSTTLFLMSLYFLRKYGNQ